MLTDNVFQQILLTLDEGDNLSCLVNEGAENNFVTNFIGRYVPTDFTKRIMT